MQRKKNMKSEKGFIAPLVAVTLFSFYIILLGLYARASFVRRSQLMADIALKSHYEVEVVALLERAQNSGFAWKKVNEEYDQNKQVVKMTFRAEDTAHNIDISLFTKNLFNGHYNVGYIDPSDGVVSNDEAFKNSIYTDLIHVGSASVYRCFGKDANTKVIWISYHGDGSFLSATTATTEEFYTKPEGAAYFRVMWPEGITVSESEKIYIYSSYTGDTSTPVYEEPSNKIRVLMNGIDINDKASITAYETSASNNRKREFVLEVRNMPTEGPLKIKIPANSISREVNGTKETNYQNIWYTRFVVKFKN